MRKTYEQLVVVLQTYSALLILVMLAAVLVGVFYRYVLDQALSWYDEFAGYLLVWVTMYGSVVGLARGKHICFETLAEKLSPQAQRVVRAFDALCVLCFSLVLLVSGWVLVKEMAGETAISVPGVKMAWIYSVMPISGGLMVLISLIKLIMLFERKDVPAVAQPKGMEEGQ
jgi:TRAP-type C4-dicarboxylate transport system permease small subunit